MPGPTSEEERGRGTKRESRQKYLDSPTVNRLATMGRRSILVEPKTRHVGSHLMKNIPMDRPENKRWSSFDTLPSEAPSLRRQPSVQPSVHRRDFPPGWNTVARRAINTTTPPPPPPQSRLNGARTRKAFTDRERESMTRSRSICQSELDSDSEEEEEYEEGRGEIHSPPHRVRTPHGMELDPTDPTLIDRVTSEITEFQKTLTQMSGQQFSDPKLNRSQRRVIDQRDLYANEPDISEEMPGDKVPATQHCFRIQLEMTTSQYMTIRLRFSQREVKSLPHCDKPSVEITGGVHGFIARHFRASDDTAKMHTAPKVGEFNNILRKMWNSREDYDKSRR